MTVRHFAPRYQAPDLLGNPAPGAKLRFYDAGTTTPRAVYSDSAGAIPISQPVVADSAGMFVQIYLQAGAYKTTLHSSADVLISTDDNLDPGLSTGAGALAIAGGGTGATTAAGARSNLGVPSQVVFDALDLRVADVETLLDNPILAASVSQTYAASFTPDFTADETRHVTLTGALAVNAPTVTAGQKIRLILIQDATGGRTWAVNAAYKFSGGAVPLLSTTANAIDVLEGYARTTGEIQVTSFKRQDSTLNAFSRFIEYDLGVPAVNTRAVATHSLGIYPALIMPFLQCTATDAGYAIGDLVPVPWTGVQDRSDGDGNSFGSSSGMNTTEAWFTPDDAILLKHKTSAAQTSITFSKWKVLMRVYA